MSAVRRFVTRFLTTGATIAYATAYVAAWTALCIGYGTREAARWVTRPRRRHRGTRRRVLFTLEPATRPVPGGTHRRAAR